MPEYINYIAGAVLAFVFFYACYRAYRKNKKDQ